MQKETLNEKKTKVKEKQTNTPLELKGQETDMESEAHMLKESSEISLNLPYILSHGSEYWNLLMKGIACGGCL